ncbi:MAG: hypothetical protein KI790_11605 [Cyclobacteriaceae bacterium]|nr:hypothetical protein [Cyclobacteriaceae bacterium HetDA_MAG_MS6]
MIKKLLFVLLLLASKLTLAQGRETKSVAIETDPTTTIFGARTLSIIIEPESLGHFSIFTNVVTADFPTWIEDLINPRMANKAFEAQIKIGGGFSVDYFLDADRTGWYFGLLNLFFKNQVSRNEQRQTFTTHNIMPRIGYRWFPFTNNNIYLNPFFALKGEYKLSGNNLVDGQRYKPQPIYAFMTVHIGYHF